MSAANKVGSGEINREASTPPPPSKLKTYGFAIAIIVGIGGLAVGAAGLTGYFQVGALSNMAQVDAFIMMAVGGGSGIILLIIGVVGTIKNQQKSASTQREKMIRCIDTQGGLVYGREAWQILNVEVLDAVPPPPRVDLSKKDKVLLYIPERVRVHGTEQTFTLSIWNEIRGGLFFHFNEHIKSLCGDGTAPGWILIDKTVIPGSQSQNYETQKQMIETKGGSMPRVLEVVVLNLMVFAFTGEVLYGLEREDPTYTRCIDGANENHTIAVGGFEGRSLEIFLCNSAPHPHCGVACVLRNF